MKLLLEVALDRELLRAYLFEVLEMQFLQWT